ncbi:nucleolar protein 8-like [Ornithodoros turicata]|uniref:Putative nucleolar protein 8 n=1 Tax=Ornithodoros turicata TaxID=34597 RepID=A0A2R5LNF6_9ACAR
MKKRLFVGNLASDVREEELREKFGKFGHVENVELRTKKDEMGMPFRTFAYLDVGLTQEKLVNCIKTYHNTVWKGNSIVVQVAKESYIEKIRREADRLNRSESNRNDEREINNHVWNKDPSTPRIKIEKTEDDNIGHGGRPGASSVSSANIVYTAKKKVETSPDEFCQQKSFLFDNLQDEEPQSFGEHYPYPRATTSSFRPHKSWEAPVNGERAPRSQNWSGDNFKKNEVEEDHLAKKRPYVDVKRKRELDNEKRLQSLKAKAAQSKMQHRALKTAFSSLDSGVSQGNKKIVFRDSDDDDDCDNNDECNTSKAAVVPRAGKRHNLFDENDDEGDEYISTHAEDDFRVRPQFQGKKGQRVWELQSRIGMDERFRLNEQFVESDNDNEGAHLEEDTNVENTDERTRNLKVLQDIIGGSVVKDDQPVHKKPIFKDTNKFRFDPTKEDASKFEVRKEAGAVASKKKKNKDPAPPEPVPEVSKEQFYEVSTSLRDALGNKKKEEGRQFSFSQMFHHGDSDDSGADPFFESDSDNDASRKKQRGKVEQKSKNKLKGQAFERNPFKHDSSDEEPHEDSVEHAEIKDESAAECDGRFLVRVDRPRFFFVPGDHRLLEGVQFFKRHDDNEAIVRKWEAMREKVFPEMMSKRKVARRAAERKYGKKGVWKIATQK